MYNIAKASEQDRRVPFRNTSHSKGAPASPNAMG